MLRACSIAALGLTACMAAIAASQAASPQGDSWDSIKKLPDWSGVWTRYHQQPGKAAPPPAGAQASAEVRAAGGDAVSFTPEYAKIAIDAAQRRAQQNLSYCLPAGTPGILQHNVLYEYLFTPGRVTMLFEDGEVRRIYTSRTTHLPLDQLTTSYMGDSIGHWEGATLVVDTVGFPKGSLFENYGVLATSQSHLVERIVRLDADHMQIDNVLTDPRVFAKPYTFSRIYTKSPLPVSEPMCAQSNRDTGTSVDLTPPPES